MTTATTLDQLMTSVNIFLDLIAQGQPVPDLIRQDVDEYIRIIRSKKYQKFVKQIQQSQPLI